MAGILHYLDFNHSITSRKLHHSHKRHNDGLEAPRNSVEFALESSQSCRAVHDDISYSCHNKSNFYPNGSSMRKLIEQEISSKSNESSKRPSVVARLMGMDPLPDPISSLLNPNEEFRDQKPIENRDFEEPQMREKHPQEEELQKFKTQFEAWQASRLLETSRSLELENFGKHKFVQSFSLQQKNRGKEREQEISLESRNSVDLPTQNSYCEEEEKEKSLSPTKIVVLKPCPEMIFNFNLDESNISSPDIIKREDNMQNFLEEVKNKLKLEIEGKCGGNNTDPKQIARNIANQIRETVVQDLNNNNTKNNNNNSKLTRSESARWYRTGTGENKDTKKLLSEKIKNVLKREMENVSSPSNPHKPRPTYDIKRKGIKLKPQIQDPKSTNEIQEIQEISSPRNLIRSLSAPVSGSGFVKLLTEELDLSSGARLERKCEHERKGRFKEGLERSGKVRNLRQNLGLRKWLFGKRIQSADERTMEGFMPVKSFVTTPSVVVNSGFIQENFTEVPPSPASVCNSPRDEMCRGGYPSPVSPLDASFIEEQHSLAVQVARETEPSNPSASFISDHIDLSTSHNSKTEENSILDEPITVEPHAKSYVKTLLVTAGLYESQPFNQLSSRCEIHAEPIPKSVFEQVEETIADKTNSADVALTEPLCDCESETSVSHKMLFDLTNEAIPSVFGASLTFEKWVLGSAPHGKKLLDDVWRRVEKSMGVRENRACSLDDLICDDLRENSWRGVFNEEMEELGVEIEFELVDDLIDELFWDVLMNIGEITR
ncbi:hypothetical protein LUZ60_014549 [Juncus effusus]|nr:hypothetical protein LUZ60_014549 [Juncus effusus]